MSADSRLFWIVLGVVAVATAAFLLYPRVKRELGPQPVTAHVAIQPEGRGIAVVGPVELQAGAGFTLHAVLEAERRDGSKIYYTEAPALRFDGRDVAIEEVEAWSGTTTTVKVLWFTVEGTVPYLELETGEDLSRFRLSEIFRARWPQAWSIPGRLEPANDDVLVRAGARGDNPFGTQRYHVRIELFERGHAIVPRERYRSAAAAAARADPAAFPTVVATLPGLLAPASRVFGLTQIEPPSGAPREMLQKIRDLTRSNLAFSRLAVLRSLLDAAGSEFDDLTWRRVDLDAGLAWEGEGGDVAPGALLRVGDRIVVLYEDQGTEGILDRRDLCFDYARGATVRPLLDVFTGRGGDVELARLTP